jgi:hypothetical protein
MGIEMSLSSAYEGLRVALQTGLAVALCAIVSLLCDPLLLCQVKLGNCEEASRSSVSA